MTTKVDNLISSYNKGDITQSALIKQAAILASEASTSNEVDLIMKAVVDSGLIGLSKRACSLENLIIANWRILRAIEGNYITKFSKQKLNNLIKQSKRKEIKV